ncbi:MAG: c-type cytochrome [Thermoanaerobaculia bacterium]
MKRLMFFALLFVACTRETNEQRTSAAGGGDANRGREAIARYGCPACHNIPDIEGPRGMVGPPLDHLAARAFIAGTLPNTPENLMAWLQNPQSVAPNAAMPNLGVTAQDAKDITAYLYTLK